MQAPKLRLSLSLRLRCTSLISLLAVLATVRRCQAATCYPAPPVQPEALDPQRLPASLATALAALQANLSANAAAHGTSSQVALLVAGGQLLLDWSYGRINASQPDSPRPSRHTIYRIGSATKLLTAMQVLAAAERGTISLDTSITTYLPQFALASIFGPAASSSAITLRQLLGHTAGLPRSSPCALSSPTPACNLTTVQALQRLATVGALIAPPGSQPQYSNLGFSLAGHTLAAVTGVPWLQALPQDVLQPLGMNSSYTSYEAIPAALRDNVAVGFSYARIPATPLDDGWESPAGSVYTTGSDLMAFLNYIFDALRNNVTQASDGAGSPLLSAAGVRDWIKPHFWNNDGVTGWGLPWELITGFGPRHQYTFYTKNGGLRGYLAELGFIPELRSGYILLQSDYTPAFDVATGFLRSFIAGALEGVLVSSPPVAPAPPLPPDVTDLVGSYRLVDPYVIPLPKTFNVTLSTVGSAGQRQLLLEGWSEPAPYLVWDQRNAIRDFFIAILPANPFNGTCDNNQQGVPGPVFFQRDNATGQVTGLELPGLYYGSLFKRLT